MNPSRRVAACLACALVLLVLRSTAAASAPDVPAASPAGSYDAIVTAAYSPSDPGAVVIVVKDGQVVYRKAVGMANVELGVALAAGHGVQAGVDHQAVHGDGGHAARRTGQAGAE